jgi:hypothetical protein
VQLIFDEWNEGQGGDSLITTSVGLTRALAAADQLGVQVNLTVGAVSPTSFTLTVYHSQDGFRWFPKYRDPSTGAAISQLNIVSFTMNQLNVFNWGEAWPAPTSMRFVQIQVSYLGPAAHIMIYNTSRKRTTRPRSAKDECAACLAAGDFPAHVRVLHALGPAELAALRRVIKSPTATARARQRGLLGLGASTLDKLNRSLSAAALQVLAGKE